MRAVVWLGAEAEARPPRVGGWRGLGDVAFSGPMGYQTNLLVYHAGGYRFPDLCGLGIRLSLWRCPFLIPVFWPLIHLPRLIIPPNALFH